MASRNADGTHISQNQRVAKARSRHVIVTDPTTDTTKKRSEEFDPSKLDLCLWMNGSDLSKFTVNPNDGKITAWEATVGGVTFTAELAWAPTSDKVNGLHAPLFNPGGVNTEVFAGSLHGGLQAPAGSNVFDDEAFSLFVVSKMATRGGVMFAITNEGDTSRFGANLRARDAGVNWIVQVVSGASWAWETDMVIGEGRTALYAVSETTAVREVWIDGARGDTGVVARDKTELDGMQIGCSRLRADTPAFPFSGHICEIIGINKNLTSDKDSLETFYAIHRYLANKWGVSDNLDANML